MALKEEIRMFSDNEIETILKSYPRLKGQSEIVREQLFGLFPSCVGCGNDGQPKAVGGISRQTESYGIKNAVNREYLQAKAKQTVDQVRSIEIAYEALHSDGQSLVKYYYYNKERRYEVQSSMNISDRQFDRIRRETLNTVNAILSMSLKDDDKMSILS
jgi:hypothetical protein